MSAFSLSGKSGTFTAASTAPTPVQIQPDDANAQGQQYILTNIGNVPAFIGWGSAAAIATLNATVPTATQTRCYCLLPMSQVAITGPITAYFTGITSSGTAIIYVSPGYGE